MLETVNIELKRCPFCWSRPTHDHVLSDEEGGYYVKCWVCKARGPRVKRMGAAIGLWNCAMIMREKGKDD
jgi:formate dehydrogenase maturation protein FdhE